MSRRRNALIFAIFAYGQSTAAMVLGLIVTRLVLARLGRDVYGIWIASGALLAYAGFADLGVLGVLPWMFAEADGRKNREQTRALVAHGLAFAVVAGVVFLLVCGVLWAFYPEILHLTASDRRLLRGPLFFAVVATSLTFPFRIFTALLMGKQDATFLGVSGFAQAIATPLLTLTLLSSLGGLYAMAVGSTLPPFLAAVAGTARARVTFHEDLRQWPPVRGKLIRKLSVDGFGAWLNAFGYTMVAGSDPLIIAFAGKRDLVTNFAVTSRLALTLTQFAWILPDAALVGLAQLNAEGTKERAKTVSIAVVHLNLLVGGAVASAVLASNPTFVRLWVGSDYFLGTMFNLLLGMNVVLACSVHGFGTVASVLGKRFQIGLSFVANGFIHVGCALASIRYVGVYGIAIATFFSGVVACLPVAVALWSPLLEMSPSECVRRAVTPWLVRFVPLAAIAFAIGRFLTPKGLVVVVASCMAYGLLYLWTMRPLYEGIPLGPRISAVLRRLRLLSAGTPTP